MNRRVKEFIDVGEHISLDELIARLVEIRANLPNNSEAELKLRGDDVFGRRITISYLRELTAEELAMDRRYADATREATRLQIERLQEKLASFYQAPPAEKRQELRFVA
jgi:hypothetical protein